MIGRVPAPAFFFIADIEAAINFWRARAPSPDGVQLSAQVAALAEVYARMAHARQRALPEADMPAAALDAWLIWYDSTPDTPCIAICSTSQGDARCKGCGRSFEEVQHWLSYSPVQKRAVWQRITQEGTALRFTRYAERAAEGPAI
ncbi:Fe-S protein [Melaminivora suipulveris]|uniref:Fe-S protein n=1 Tax=Melaminivora suipulveris TaxID=2109913 RepID=A0A2R3QCU1_9BURK|nr:Fe-S protein [Melaminivora suipulveris]